MELKQTALKQALEAATETLDVRPGFVGDVMAGARRRHTRKLVTVTAVVALLAGLTAGVVLTSSAPEPTASDARLTAATTGDLAGDTDFIARSLVAWGQLDRAWQDREAVTEVSAAPHVFWAANTPGGQAALVVQPVRVRNSEHPQTMVGLVADGAVVDRELVYEDSGRENGIYQFGPGDSTFVVLGQGKRVFWSVNPVRGPDQRWSRTWQQAQEGPGGVAVVTANPAEKPVFLRSTTTPASDDFSRVDERVISAKELGLGNVITPHPGLGWQNVMWASKKQEPGLPSNGNGDRSVLAELQKLGYLDYGTGVGAFPHWEVRAWLPDGRYASVFETNGELICALYHPDGRFDRVVLGGPAVRGAVLPVRITLPDEQGTILAERGVLLGPEERRDAWLAPPGTTEVAVWQSGQPTTVPLK